MPGGSVIVYTATGTIDPSAPSGTLSDTATVSVPNGVTDPVLTNNSATDSDPIVLSADLKVTVTGGQSRYTTGASDTYTIVVTNFRLDKFTGVSVLVIFSAFFCC